MDGELYKLCANLCSDNSTLGVSNSKKSRTGKMKKWSDWCKLLIKMFASSWEQCREMMELLIPRMPRYSELWLSNKTLQLVEYPRQHSAVSFCYTLTKVVVIKETERPAKDSIHSELLTHYGASSPQFSICHCEACVTSLIRDQQQIRMLRLISSLWLSNSAGLWDELTAVHLTWNNLSFVAIKN